MTTVIIFSILGTLLLISIILSSIAYKRQQAITFKKSQIQQLTRSIQDLQETLNTLLQIDNKYELIIIIHSQILAFLEKKLALEPNNATTKNQLEQQQLLNSSYKKEQRDNDINRKMPNDEAINLANFQLLQTNKLLHKFRSKNKISSAKYTELTNHIQKLRLDIEVESHIEQANAYQNNKDIIMTQSHLKQAREALRGSPIEFPEKAQLIRELTERIKNVHNTSAIQVVDTNEIDSTNTGTLDKDDLKKRY